MLIFMIYNGLLNTSSSLDVKKTSICVSSNETDGTMYVDIAHIL